MTDDYLLGRLTDALNGWRGWSVKRELDDKYGTYALVIRHATAGSFVSVCKKSLHNGDVSVMTRAVDAAARADVPVCVFVFQDVPTLGRSWAFRPDTIRCYGRAFEIESKKGVPVDAYQLDPKTYGAVLGDVIGGHAELPKPSVTDRTTQGRLGKLGGEA